MLASFSLKRRLLLSVGLAMIAAVLIPLIAIYYWGGKVLGDDVEWQLDQAQKIVQRLHLIQINNRTRQFVSMQRDLRLLNMVALGETQNLSSTATTISRENNLRSLAFLSTQGQVMVSSGLLDEAILAKAKTELSGREVHLRLFAGDAYVAWLWIIPLTLSGENIGYALAIEEFTPQSLENYELVGAAGVYGGHVELWGEAGTLITDHDNEAHVFSGGKVAKVMLDDGLYFKILIDTVQVSNTLLATFHILLIASGLCVAGGLMVARIIAGRFSGPVRALARVSRQVAAGNYQVRAIEKGAPELAELGKSFNNMIGELQLSQSQMEDYARKLEHRVEKRTRKLREEVAERQAAEQRVGEGVREIEQAHEQLKQNQTQLVQSEKMASLGQISAGVAHEINNPVGFIMSNMGTLKEYVSIFNALFAQYHQLEDALELRQQQEIERLAGEIRALREKEDLKFILDDVTNLVAETQDGANRVRDIVKDLKSFARVDEVEVKMVNINEGIESTLRVIWNELKYKCTVEKHYGELPDIRCYPGQLNQVFMNILVNAAHAIPEKGVVSIVTQATDQEITIRISDTGEGISKENLEKLFNPFFTTKPSGKGTGLGLSIAFGIIERHQGAIDVESEVGSGTTFTITLPLDGIPEDLEEASLA